MEESKKDSGRDFFQRIHCGTCAAYWSLVNGKRLRYLFQKLHELHPDIVLPLDELDKLFEKEAQEEFNKRFPLVKPQFEPKPISE